MRIWIFHIFSLVFGTRWWWSHEFNNFDSIEMHKDGRKPNCNRSPECLDLKWRGIKRYATEKGRINAYATETGVIHQHQSTNISTHWRSRPKMAWILLKYTDRYVQPYLKSWKSCVTKLRILREFSLSSMDIYLFLNLVVNLT